MYCWLLQIFMFQLSSAFNPASTTNANLDPFEGSEVYCAYRYISLNTLHWNQGRSRALAPQHFGKCVRMLVGGRGGGHILLCMAYGNNFISNWIFCIKAKKVQLPRCLKLFCLFVCLLVLFLFFCFCFACFCFACQFCKLPLFLCTAKAFFPTFWSISKAWSLPLSPFVTPLHMYNIL